MKTVSYSLILCWFFAFNGIAQQINNVHIDSINAQYIETTFRNKSMSAKDGKIMFIDYGQERYWKESPNKTAILVDKEQNEIIFNSDIDGLNYLHSIGFELVETYEYSRPTNNPSNMFQSKSNIYYILRKKG